MSAPACCRPSQRDEDRTHSVSYHQAAYRNGEVAWEEQGTAEVCCTHNDAVATAAFVAGRFEVGMKPRGNNGIWMGSEVLEGDGEKAEVWVSRGPSEEDYDAARSEEEAAGG